MRKIRDYIYYRVYELSVRNGQKRKVKHNIEGAAVDNANYSVEMYQLLCVEILFYIALGIIEFDMNPIRNFYIIHKKEIVIILGVLLLIWVLLTNKRYKNKVKNGWLDELRLKYHKEKYSFSAIWIIVFPFVMILVVPIVFAMIKGTLRILDTHTGDVIWSIS